MVEGLSTVEGDGAAKADVYALDPFTTTARVVASIHARRRVAVCHLRIGVWEPDRPDADRFDRDVIGAFVAGAGPQRWLDVRRWDALAEVLGDRLSLCAAKGFDGVALSDVEGYGYSTGFPLVYADQATFNGYVIGLARRHRLVACLVGSPDTPARGAADVTVQDR